MFGGVVASSPWVSRRAGARTRSPKSGPCAARPESASRCGRRAGPPCGAPPNLRRPSLLLPLAPLRSGLSTDKFVGTTSSLWAATILGVEEIGSAVGQSRSAARFVDWRSGTPGARRPYPALCREGGKVPERRRSYTTERPPLPGTTDAPWVRQVSASAEKRDTQSMSATNCWEHKKCGRQPGGPKVAELGVCGAATVAAVNGLNGGKNGGRACWVIAGTLCGGKVQGSFATKLANCSTCDFYRAVKAEEGSAYVNSVSLLKVLAP